MVQSRMGQLAALLAIACGVLFAQPANEVRVKKYGPLAANNPPWIPHTFGRAFPETGANSIQNFPQPLVNGAVPSVWQADVRSRWSNGRVRHAVVSLPLTGVTASLGDTRITFADNAAACSNPCTPVSQSEMLSLGWGAQLRAEAVPANGTSAFVFDAKAEIGAGRYETLISGPFHSRIKIHREDVGAARDFGWKRRAVVRATATVIMGSVSLAVEDTSNLAQALQTAQFIEGFFLDGAGNSDRIRVCGVANSGGSPTILLGASQSNCAATPSDQGFVPSANFSSGTLIEFEMPGEFTLQLERPLNRTDSRIYLTGPANVLNTIAPEEASILQIGAMYLRTCAKQFTGAASLRATIGYGVCTASPIGRGWYGSANPGIAFPVGTVVKAALHGQVWSDAPAAVYKSLHPVIVADIYRSGGSAFVKVEFRVENERTRQDQLYRVDLRTGPNLERAVWSSGAIRHIASTRWRRVAWDADAAGTPPALRTDHSTAYLSDVGVNPLDPNAGVADSAVDAEFSKIFRHDSGWHLGYAVTDSAAVNSSTFNTGSAPAVLQHGVVNDRCAAPTLASWDQSAIFAGPKHIARDNAGPVIRLLNGGGGRPEIGVLTKAQAIWLQAQSSNASFADELADAVLSMAHCLGYIPVHLREPEPRGLGRGQPVTLDGRPSFNSVLPHAAADPADSIPAIGLQTTNGWVINSGTLSHFPPLAFLPYVLTGDDYFLDLIQTAAGFALLADGSVYPVSAASLNLAERRRSRGKRLGLLPVTDGTRTFAWGYRDLGHAAWASRAGTAGQAYFESRLLNNAAALNGMFGSINCAPPSSDPLSDPVTVLEAECFGRWHRGFNAANPTRMFWVGSRQFNDVPDFTDRTRAASIESPWMTSYLFGALGWIARLGYPQADFARQEMGKLFVTYASDDQTVYAGTWYRIPSEPCHSFDGGVGALCFSGASDTHASAARVGFSSWQQLKASYLFLPDQFALTSHYSEPDGYAIMFLGALGSLPSSTGCLDGSLAGCTRDAAHDNLRLRVERALGASIQFAVYQFDPRWAIQKR